MPVRMVACEVRTPERTDVAALSTREVGWCGECRAWLYTTSDGKLPAHERAELEV